MTISAASCTTLNPESGTVNEPAGRGTPDPLLAAAMRLHPAGFTAGRVFFREVIGAHVANMNLGRTRFKHVGGAASIAKTMAFHTGESMPKGYRPDLIRAGRPPKLSRVIAQCNADAERMRREAEQRAKTDKPAPVVLKGAV